MLEFLDFPVLVGWFRAFVDVFRFKGTEAIRRRRRRRRVVALLGFVLLVSATGVAAWQLGLLSPAKADLLRVRQEAETAQKEKDYARALTLWEELAAAGGEEADAAYQRGLCLAQLDRREEARSVMTSLAERDAGYALANVWLADDLLEKRKTADRKDLAAINSEIERNLSEAIARDGKLNETIRKLAHWKISLTRTSDPKTNEANRNEAIRLYERLAEESLDDRLTLAMLYAAARKPESVGSPARSALSGFQSRLDKDPDELRSRVQAVQAALLLRDFDLAERLLLDGLRRPGEKDDERLRFALGAVHSEWAEDLARKGALGDAVAMLLDSVRDAPGHAPTLERLAVLGRRPEWREVVRAALFSVLFEGNSMQGQVHGLLAGLAAREGRRSEARLHWQMAADYSTDSIVPLNELALLAMTDSPPNLPGALALAERGLAIAPRSSHLRSTRGRILAMQGKLAEALPDLEVALRASPTDPALNAALYDVYTRQGIHDLAEKHFSQAVESMPRLWTVRARLLMTQGEKAQARKLAEDASLAFRERLRTHPADFETSLLLLETQMLMGDFAGAVKVLEPALESPRKAEINLALAQVYAEWAVSEGSATKDATVSRLERLEKAVTYDPENRLAIQDLALISRAGGPQAARAGAAIEKLLTRDPPSALAFFAAGTSALGAGDKAAARKFLERAHEIDPTSAEVANNLVWTLEHSKPEDLARAMSLAEIALRRSPEHPNYRGTRGHLLARMKRWAEARGDLEHALKYREDADNRRVLNEVYKELGVRGPAAAPQGSGKEEGPAEKKGELKDEKKS